MRSCDFMGNASPFPISNFWISFKLGFFFFLWILRCWAGNVAETWQPWVALSFVSRTQETHLMHHNTVEQICV